MRRLRHLQSLVHDTVDAVTHLVGDGHASAARTTVAALSLVPPLRAPARQVDTVRDALTRRTLGAIRGVNRAVRATTDIAWDALPTTTAPDDPVPLRSDALLTPTGAADQLVGVLNGVVGDHLRRTANGLDLRLRLRHEDRWLDDGPHAIPGATPDIVVLVHGLSTTETSWCLDTARTLGDAAANFGTLLRRDLGLTPVFARYNTGLPIAESATDLAAALDGLVTGWPVPPRRVVLLGHSMGGLVSRLAADHAARAGRPWHELLSDVVCLGSPHRGAPLARLGRLVHDAARRVDLPATRVLAGVLGARSAGIRDLSAALRAPLPSDVRHTFVAGTLTDDPAHPAGRVLGDLLVTVASASGPDDTGQADVRTVLLGRAPHHALQTDPRVYAAVRDALGRHGVRERRPRGTLDPCPERSPCGSGGPQA